MEAVAALSLAANVFQVVDFAHKLLSTSQQIYQAGSTVQNAELEVVVQDFAVLNMRLQKQARPDPDVLGPLSKDDQGLETLALESEKIAQELITILTRLHFNEDAPRYKSYLQAIQTAWNSKKIAETKQRLDEIQKAIQFRIQVSMKEDILNSVDEVTRQIIVVILQGRDEIVQHQQTLDALASKRHDQIMNLASSKWDTNMRPEDILSRIKAQLRFQRQDDRIDDIVEAHQTTFQWALHHEDSTHLGWPNLYNWLREGGGVYWISGKAGSGKSTLMKFIYQDPRLHEALNLWAGGAQLLIVRFYFWNPGSDLQKSQEGLLRSLLNQILDQRLLLAQVLFPEQFMPGANWSEFPTFHTVRRAFGRLTKLDDESIKIAMLVDGLDEFDATDLTMTELAEIFIAITKSTNFKALLSSRPLAPFEFAFEGQPKLRLHQLTHNDITTYVDDKLARHARILQLAIDNSDGVQALIAEIVDSASGVFLWVKLVVRSLLEGLQNYDKLHDLQNRLRALPRDLEHLFRHMLRNIPAEYKVESSQIFQIVRNQSLQLSATDLKFAVDADDDTVLRMSIAILPEDESRSHEQEIEGRLRSRCAGLLEVNLYHEKSTSTVDYLHKSVADFLAKDNVWADLVAHTSGTEFDADVALLRAYVMRIKYMEPDFRPTSMMSTNIFRALSCAKRAEGSARTELSALLDELDRTVSIHLRSACKDQEIEDELQKNAGGLLTSWCNWFDNSTRDEPWHTSFLGLTTSFGLILYVENKLNELGMGIKKKKGRPLLSSACCPFNGSVSWGYFIEPRIADLLLERGGDPNQKWGSKGKSVWQDALIAHLGDPFKWVTVLRHLVLYGADPNACIDEEEGGGKIIGEDSEEPGRVVRKSALRYLRSHFILITRGNWDQFQDLKYWSHVLSSNRGHTEPPPDVLTKFEVEADALCQLLISKGAREKEWLEIGNGTFKKVYSGVSKSSQNPVKRIFRRIYRH